MSFRGAELFQCDTVPKPLCSWLQGGNGQWCAGGFADIPIYPHFGNTVCIIGLYHDVYEVQHPATAYPRMVELPSGTDVQNTVSTGRL